MLLFGHAGITLGAATLLSGVTGRKGNRVTESGTDCSSASADPDCSRETSWVTSLASRIDVRLLLVGSLLPDIIDKPVGQLFFRETISNGRIFCHTLLFLAIISLAGWCLYRHYGRKWLLVLSFGTFTHLILDEMWLAPGVLLWPAYGFAFDRIELGNWMPNMWYALLTQPRVFLPELLGLAVVLWFAWELLRRRQVWFFLRYGQVR